jgi:aminoglycoside phosphotransferase (APT) family kinase protein
VWLHGDLHPANIIVSRELPDRVGLVAVIDFGDLTAGDPATDLAAAWLVFDADARAVFRTRLDELVETDADTWRRARGWALCIASAAAAHSDDDHRMAAAGRHGLQQVLLGE